MRWTIRFIGLVSTVILARLLSPDDFGVAAMAMLISAFLFELTEFGTSLHLIRAKAIDRAQCDTAWTITLLQGLFLSLTLMLFAQPVSAYFSEPRVVAVMYVLALATFVHGFENIGPVLARRELKFGLDFRFNVYKKLLIFVTTVGCALYFRSYWALVFGHLAGTATGVILSYLIHPYRPSWSLAKVSEYLRFALSVIPMRAANIMHVMAPRFLVGSLGNASTMGSFTVSNSLATMFTQEIVVPMGRGLFPNYSRLAGDPTQLSATYRQVLGIVSLLCIPVGIGMSAVANDLVAVLLGPQWGFAAILIEYLAIGGVIYAVSHTMNNQILIATGRERSAALLAWLRLGLTLPILLLGLSYDGVLGLTKATIAAPLVCLPVIYMETRRAVDLSIAALAGLIWRPSLAALVMYMTVKLLHPEGVEWTVLRLGWDIAVGGCTYVATTLLLWLASGRPEGAERICLNLLERRLKFARRRDAA